MSGYSDGGYGPKIASGWNWTNGGYGTIPEAPKDAWKDEKKPKKEEKGAQVNVGPTVKDVASGAVGTLIGSWAEKLIETAAARKGVGQGWDNEIVWPGIVACGATLAAMFTSNRVVRIASIGAAAASSARVVGAYMGRSF
jgi:hypothetical protein